jgi:DNA-binding NarL/FixJ family response regulator
MAATRVLIVSERAFVRAAVETCLQDSAAIVGRADSAAAALRLAQATRPDVIAVDLAACPLAQRDLVVALRARGIHIVAISTCADIDIVVALLNAGVEVYLLDENNCSPLAEAIRATMDGSVPIVDKRLEATFAAYMLRRGRRPRKFDVSDFSDEDIRILSYLTEGYGNKEIGDHIGLTDRGVENRLERLYSALNVRNRTEAAARSAELGLHRPQKSGRNSA